MGFFSWIKGKVFGEELADTVEMLALLDLAVSLVRAYTNQIVDERGLAESYRKDLADSGILKGYKRNDFTKLESLKDAAKERLKKKYAIHLMMKGEEKYISAPFDRKGIRIGGFDTGLKDALNGYFTKNNLPTMSNTCKPKSTRRIYVILLVIAAELKGDAGLDFLLRFLTDKSEDAPSLVEGDMGTIQILAKPERDSPEEVLKRAKEALNIAHNSFRKELVAAAKEVIALKKQG